MSETVGALVPTTGANGESKNLPLELADLAERASQYAKLSKAANTKRAYETDWRAFVSGAGTRSCRRACAAGSRLGLFGGPCWQARHQHPTAKADGDPGGSPVR